MFAMFWRPVWDLMHVNGRQREPLFLQNFLPPHCLPSAPCEIAAQFMALKWKTRRGIQQPQNCCSVHPRTETCGRLKILLRVRVVLMHARRQRAHEDDKCSAAEHAAIDETNTLIFISYEYASSLYVRVSTYPFDQDNCKFPSKEVYNNCTRSCDRRTSRN